MLYCLGFPLNHWVYEVRLSILALVLKDLILTIKYVICCRCPLSVKGCLILFLFFWIMKIYAAAAKSLQLCPTQCDPIDSSPPGSSVPGILQARTLEWVAISFSNAGDWKVKMKSLSCVWLFATPWTVAYQAPPSVGFSRQECWSGVPLPSPKLC